MRNIIVSVLAFIITVIVSICVLPLFMLTIFLAYRRYLFHMYARMLLSMSFYRMMEAITVEEW